MSNYYEEIMPLFTNKDEYLKYYFEESLPIFDKLNTIIKKGQPFQRQALIKNLIVYEKEPLFKSLINFIIDDIPTWDAETVLLLPKTLYLLIINTDYVLENDLFNLIFKHMILSVSSGAEKNKNEYTFYFNKIIEFYSIIDINDNNKIKKNFFQYTINDDIIELIDSLGIFGQTAVNRKLSCYLSSSLCRIMVNLDGENNNLNTDNIKRLYKRLSYLFCDGDKIIESQMARELLYIIPIFKDFMFTNEDITQAIESYINHDTDHIIQVMGIISVLKNIVYLNKENKIINILLTKIKEITEDFDYEPIYKNTILHILINELYNNYLNLNPWILYQVFQLGIMKNYDDFYKLDILFIKNFGKYYFLISYFLEKAEFLENQYKENIDNGLDINYRGYEKLVENIQTSLNFEEYFIKIYNELFLAKDNTNEKTISNDANTNTKENEEYLGDQNNNNEILFGNYALSSSKEDKNKINFNNLIFDKYFFEQNLDLIFNKKITDGDLYNNLYSKDLMRKTLYIYIPKIITCFPNLKNNKYLCDKILSLFDKNNIIAMLNIYSLSTKYIMEKNRNDNNNDLDKNNNKKKKKIPLYELMLFLLKKNLKLFLQQGKITNKSNNNKEPLYCEGNIYNKLVLLILTNINLIYQETPNLIENESHILIGKILKLLMPKFHKYYKNITYNTVVNNNSNNPNNNSNNINNSFNNNKETIKVCYFEKIYEELFNKFISKIIKNNNLGHHVIKEYIETIPYFILFSKNRWKYYDFFMKEIFSSDSFYKRKYSIIFYNQCFKVFSFGFICKNGLLNDFIILMKDKVNLISTNAIELIYNFSKKIICYSTKKFQELCAILNEIYELNIKAFNDNESKDKNKNKGIIFDKEKNIIINKIISINNNINKYYTEEEISEEKEIENKLYQNELEIFKLDKSINNKNKSKININPNFIISINNGNVNGLNNNNIINSNNNTNEHNKINANILQFSSSNFQSNKNVNYSNINSSVFPSHKLFGSMINNKNSLNLFNLSQKEKGHKISPWIEKSSSGLFKDKKGKNSNSKNNIVNFNKDGKPLNNEINNTHYNNRHNSTSKNINSYNKHYLPKLSGLKMNRKDLNYINNNNIRSIDITFNKVNIKIDDNEEKNYNNINHNHFLENNDNTNIFNKKEYNIEIMSDKKIIKNDLRLSITQNRIPSAKIKIMNSYPIMSGEDNPNLNIKNNDNEKKISSNNSNLRCNYLSNKNVNSNNFNIKSISNKHINMILRPKSKTIKLRRDSYVSGNAINKIYIDANK